jgi:predicted transcriptional regulator
MKSNYMIGVDEVSKELGVSKGHAYKVIRELNEELSEKGFIVVAGKVPKAYWETKFFGYSNVNVAM